ncbi:MAG: hypothetical protein UT05_C0001G0087 [Parcubacteria group bacterium GW2011_GWF2_38_76]|nr:MAG: hypothetical protein UT05_C0001G0087 [Parcubacteria group bacterium GW2011_GWF2_38_76]HBM45937.1 hypothetical protein [Patescibacteria group bacterium]
MVKTFEEFKKSIKEDFELFSKENDDIKRMGLSLLSLICVLRQLRSKDINENKELEEIIKKIRTYLP